MHAHFGLWACCIRWHRTADNDLRKQPKEPGSVPRVLPLGIWRERELRVADKVADHPGSLHGRAAREAQNPRPVLDAVLEGADELVPESKRTEFERLRLGYFQRAQVRGIAFGAWSFFVGLLNAVVETTIPMYVHGSSFLCSGPKHGNTMRCGVILSSHAFSPSLDGEHGSRAAPDPFLEAPSVPIAALVPNGGMTREVPVFPGTLN